MDLAGSSRSGEDNKVRNEEECQLSKASALRELEKARVRECQMEKTVRWWTVCTAGWRKKWSKLRQENEDLRKQIKSYKTQLNDVTQDCTVLNNQLDTFNAHNAYLKGEVNKLLLKYGDENNEQIQEILKTPEIIKPNTYTCANCLTSKSEMKNAENTLSTPEAELQLFPESNEKYSLMDDAMSEGKNVEVLTEMIAKIFAELQTLKGEFVKHNDGTEYKDLPEILMSADQISQLKIYTLSKQLEKEKNDKTLLLKKLEQAKEEMSRLQNKIKEAKLEEFLLQDEAQMSFEMLSLSDEE